MDRSRAANAGRFGIDYNGPAWRTAVATQHDSSAQHDAWTDYRFGEPSVTLLPDGTALLVRFGLH